MFDPPSSYRQRSIARYADDLFEQSWRKGQFKKWWARLTNQSRQPPLLSDMRRLHPHFLVHELGDQPIRLEHIIGTEGKLSFDRDFHPLQRRSKNRWVSIAQAILNDPTSLPPIDVVQIGDDYYVRDGHHRVSVVKALGHLYIDGNVTQWDTEDHAADDQ
jgi:hypothetical protein